MSTKAATNMSSSEESLETGDFFLKCLSQISDIPKNNFTKSVSCASNTDEGESNIQVLSALADDSFDNDRSDDLALLEALANAEATSEENHGQNHPIPSEKKPKKLFASVDNTTMTKIEMDACSLGTRKQTQWGVKLFREWLLENEENANFEDMSKEVLDEKLRRFYAAARTTDGTLYSKSTYVGIRASISRHLRAPPHSKTFTILDDPAFHKSNTMFKAMLRKIKRECRDKTCHRPAISESDLTKLRNSDVYSCTTPRSLQRKVWFDVTLSFARRGRENLRDLSVKAFVFSHDDAGSEFVEMAYNEATKNHPGDNLKDRDFESKPRMYSTGDAKCPVASLRTYIARRNKSNDTFFQQPRAKVSSDDECWYTSRPIGQRLLNDMMKTISVDAGLSQIYTNHCVRATTITLLSHAGVEAREIMRISGHRNEQSIRSYNTDSSDTQKRKYSSILQGVSSALEPLPVKQSIINSEKHAEPQSSSNTVNYCQENNLILPNQSSQKQFEINNSSVYIYNIYK